MRRKIPIIAYVAAFTLVSGAYSAPLRKLHAPSPSTVKSAKPPTQSCDAHKFETEIQLIGRDGNPRQSKVRLCGDTGQSDADWIRTLQDAVAKTASNPNMPAAVKEQIISAVKAEIIRLSTLSLQLPSGGDLSKLPKAPLPQTTERPLSRDYGSLPPLPSQAAVEPPHLLGPGGLVGPALGLRLRCAVAGDEDRPSDCAEIDKDTIIIIKAEEAFPSGLDLGFSRHGDKRADLHLGPIPVGQLMQVHLPRAVCAGVVRSRVEITAQRTGASSGTAPSTIGEYDLRC